MEIDKSLAASTTTLVPSNITDATSMPNSVPNFTQTTIMVTSSASVSIATQNLVNGLPPLPVGREFVRQYYTMMGKSPKNLYRFYSANSTLTFGNNPILIGQDRIRMDIERRQLRNCHAYIIKIDSQPTLGNGVVVQVIGELSNNDEALRPFTQTFVLSPHIPKNFYVHNEIFRYQDELYPEISLEALKLPVPENQLTTTTKADQVISGITDSWTPPSEPPPIPLSTKIPSVSEMECDEIEPVVFAAKKNQQRNCVLSVGIQASSMLEALQVSPPIRESMESVKWELETSTQPISEDHTHKDMQISSPVVSVNPSPLIPSNPIEYYESKSTPKEVACNVENPQNDNEPQGQTNETSNALASDQQTSTPMTYANVFKSASGLLKQSQNSENLTTLKSDANPIFIRSAIFTASTSLFVPTTGSDPPAAKVTVADNKPSKKDRADGANNFVTVGKNVENNLVKSTSFHQQRRPRQRRERYDEGLQLFLGNLPVGATIEALTTIFQRYGTILELRVLSKAVQPGMRKLPNYGFLTYDCAEAVQRCLNNGPFYFPENTRNGVRLNVRPKNSDENQSARTIKPPMNNYSPADCGRNTAYFAEKATGRRFDKRRRVSNSQESDHTRATIGKEKTADVGNNTRPIKREEQKSLLMEDWPQLCGPSSEGGGGGSGGMRRKKDMK